MTSNHRGVGRQGRDADASSKPNETGRPTPADETHGAQASPQIRRSKRSLPGRVASHGHPVPQAHAKGIASFSFALNRQKLRIIRRREGRYLLRTNLLGRDPAQLWQFYIRLVEIEATFKNLKGALALRLIFTNWSVGLRRISFFAFLAYCLHVTLRVASAGTRPEPTCVPDKFAAIQMLDVHFPTTDGRTLILSRYTYPKSDQKILIEQLKLDQPPPRISLHPLSPGARITIIQFWAEPGTPSRESLPSSRQVEMKDFKSGDEGFFR
jgi:hypothetical protein